jgi:hypothetical protein
MNPSQRRAIRQILRFYRDRNSDNFSTRIKIASWHGSTLYVKVWTRWDGGKDRVGSTMESSATFVIGKRGGIKVLTAFGCRGSEDQHVAFMLGARTSYGTTALKHRPSSYRGKGKTRKVWDIADAMPGASRKEVLEACADHNINPNTAATQYAAWKRLEKACGRAK